MRTLTIDSPDCTDAYDEVIDVRSPAEFAVDHIPGAINLPVLDDAQRALVGTLHRQAGEFEARKRGAALVSVNIARHLDAHFAAKGKGYRALVYCWRGGQRSRSMATVLDAVGWQATVVAGGYKGYRAFVRDTLEAACARLQPVILSGLTGSGKTRILRRMAGTPGAPQALDLEGLANHRGSLLGEEVGTDDARQPSQKRFESLLLRALGQLDLSRPVFIESESKRIGSVACPESLWLRMVGAPVVRVEVPIGERARFLVNDYRHFVTEPEQLISKLPVLKRIHGAGQSGQWAEMIHSGDWLPLAESLLAVHYDPSYRRCDNYQSPAATITLPALDDGHVGRAIAELAAFAATVSQIQPAAAAAGA